MAKVLKVTKSDKTVHVVPIGNKSFYQHLNAKVLKGDQQMKLEDVDEKDTVNLPYFDETYVSGSEAQTKVPELQKEIAALKAKLAAKNEAPGDHDGEDEEDGDESEGDSEDDPDDDVEKPKTPRTSRASKRKKA